MHLIAGLGNPGPSYAGHRHNIGFILCDALHAAYGFPAWTSKFNALLSKGLIAGKPVLLCKPQTFMNKSGQAVGETARFFQIAPDQVWVLHDELDLPLAKIRVKLGGGHGGHNGLRDIDRHLGKDYWRLRFGIDHPGHKDQVSPYVLSDFAKSEQQEVAYRVDDIVRDLPIWLQDGHEAFMTKLALRKE
ncbi:MAG: aminoacyl-tRNA hydrolase [Rickettsiales bacterium]|nr:aminoacyl-tRNA hydrolase [Rickettsiales bacterium]|tara:strand:- start:462 stop:1028 length:567 start_codon:yes stop_codon:yes gene_type:complete